jgi:serine/threonine protein kinase
MSIKAKDRYQTIAEFRKDLLSHTVTINLNKQTISNQCPFVIKELNTHQIDTNTTREKEGDWNRCYKYWIYIDKKGKPNFVKVVYLDNHSVNSIDLDELANQITEEERIFYKLENYFIAGAIREIDVLSKLDHKNIIKIKNMYEYNNHLHIYYDVDISENFRTLEEYINQNIEYSEESIIDFALTMLNTLKYMHNKNIIHNNIHPKNILIIDNQPILFNFQYSLLKNEKENIPDDGEDRIISGENIIYNSIFTFLSEKFSFFSNYYRDIYSLGIILYILLTNNKNINLAVDRIYKKGYYLNFPKYLNKKYSKTLIYAIKIATSVNPKDGFQSAQEMIDFIENKKTINRFNPFDWIKMK